jgi:hypothetical protein
MVRAPSFSASKDPLDRVLNRTHDEAVEEPHLARSAGARQDAAGGEESELQKLSLLAHGARDAKDDSAQDFALLEPFVRACGPR